MKSSEMLSMDILSEVYDPLTDLAKFVRPYSYIPIYISIFNNIQHHNYIENKERKIKELTNLLKL